MKILCLCILAVALGGCASRAPLITPDTTSRLPPQVELSATPFFPQSKYQCGPAALATILAASGIDIDADELTDKVYLPARRGSLQLELVAAARGYDRLAYQVEPRLEALLEEIAAGRPVLVLQNLALKRIPVWHYAVVIGYDAARDAVILRSGTTRRLEMPAHRFIRGWALAEQWGLLILKPGEMPARADRDRYLEAAAGLETSALKSNGPDAATRVESLLKAYQAALQRWPADTTALLGLGNVHYHRHELAEAAAAYRQLLIVDPRNAVAHNNLAQVLLEQGDPQLALEEITRARSVLDDQRFAPLLDETEQEIRRTMQPP